MKQGLIQALCIAALAGLPAACGAPTSPIPASGAIAQNRIALDALPYHKTFTFTGKKQTFIVPAGVTSITVVARGAAGTDAGKYGVVSGLGGRVYADIPVTPGETLYVFVGGAGTSSDGRGVGGFNGGGNSGYCCDNAEGGGGGTDIREGGDQLRHRILVAGGGGGQGGLYGGIGGNGGGLTGADGGRGTSFGSADSNGNGGSGGTQYAGGSGGKGGKANGYRSYPGKRGKPGLFGTADVAHGAVEENRATPTAPPVAVAAAVTTAVAAAVVVLGAATEAMDRQAAVALAARHTLSQALRA